MTKWIACICFSVALVATACDEDDSGGGSNDPTPDASTGADLDTPDTGTPDTGTPDTGAPDTGTPDTGTPDTGAPDTGTPDTGTPDLGTPDTGTPDADVATGDAYSAGACDNPADRGRLRAIESEIPDAMGTCAFECIVTGGTCAAECSERELEISSECATCFGDMIACTTASCALNCLTPDSPQCLECQEENCFPGFETCAGLDVPGS